jgi:outer membrane protein OmpA-like peptidoglycan-associated protein
MLRKALISSILLLSACNNPQEGPDKTIGGAVLGAGWGAGAGAVIGNQVGYSGEGTAIGAGFGMLGGALTGFSNDLTEDAIMEQEKTLASLKIQNDATSRQLSNLQTTLDSPSLASMKGGMHQIFFDVDVTSLKAGSIADLEILAEQIKSSPNVTQVNIVGHSDDAGTPEYNSRLAEARARSVSTFLASKGIPLSQIKITSYGSQRPVASNTSDVGRQLNRRVDIYLE